jgi:hypothetical protein
MLLRKAVFAHEAPFFFFFFGLGGTNISINFPTVIIVCYETNKNPQKPPLFWNTRGRERMLQSTRLYPLPFTLYPHLRQLWRGRGKKRNSRKTWGKGGEMTNKSPKIQSRWDGAFRLNRSPPTKWSADASRLYADHKRLELQ